MENKRTNKKKAKPIINLKSTVEFFNRNLKKKTRIMFVILALISVIFIIPTIKEVKSTTSSTATLDISLWNFIKDKIFFLLITAIAGVVPYLYIAVAGGIGYVYQTLVEYAYIIVDKGYFLGSTILIIPFVLNLICISIITALGMYLCKINTNNFVLSGQRNMNFTRFRLELAKVTRNKEKEEKIQKKIDEKEEKLQSRDTKIKYKEVLIVFGIVCVFQIISSLIQCIFI